MYPLKLSSNGNIVRHKRIEYIDAVYDGEYSDGNFNGLGTFTSSHQQYTGSFKNGYFHGSGTLNIKDTNGESSKYEGRFKDGKRNGLGVFVDIHGNTWDGTWVDDSFTGRGQISKSNGDKLIGEFRNGKLECAAAIILFANGDRYDGPCRRGLMDGTSGKFTYKRSMSFYEGSFRQGMKHGTGIYILMDGSCYKGDFYEDSMQGYGVMEYSGVRPWKMYKGQWQDGRFHGEGELLYKETNSISSYHGSFVRGNFCGTGKVIYRDGGFYEGEFKAPSGIPVKDGHGTRSWKNGTIFTGLWKRDEMVMGVIADSSTGSNYIGTFDSGRKSGKGREIWKVTNQKSKKVGGMAWLQKSIGLYLYEGEWRNGSFEGRGNYFAPDGREYRGQWKGGLPSGDGEAILLSKLEQVDKRKGSLYRPFKYSGEWLGGARHGHGTLYYLDGSCRSGIFEHGNLIKEVVSSV